MVAIYKPSIDYFKSMFPIFDFFTQSKGDEEKKEIIPGQIDTEFLDYQLGGITKVVQARLNKLGYTEPTEANNLPYLNLKNYIVFYVANMFRFQYAGNNSALENLELRVKELEALYLKDLESFSNSLQDTDSVSLTSKGLKP